MSRHEPTLAQEALAQEALARAEAQGVTHVAPQAAPPRPQVTLIGGVADGRRCPRPQGSTLIARAGAAQELYMLSRAHLASGQPVEFWHARSLAPAEALARALDLYPRAEAA